MSGPRKLTIFQINDTHGYLEPHPELIWAQGKETYAVLGGYARIATLLQRARDENPGGVVALDNGDTFYGTYPAVTSRGEALIPLVNALQLDAMTAHWEFAWGPSHFQALADRLDYPVLAINCYDKETGERPFPASILIDRAGLRIGVIGIAATIIDKSMPPHFSEGLRFTLGNEELLPEIERLKRHERADVIVVLSHLGFPQDVKLAHMVEGIDVLLSGHTHNRLVEPARVGRTIIIQSGCHGSFVGRLDLDVTDEGITAVSHTLIPVDESIVPDRGMQRLVEEAMGPYRALLAEKVGQTAVGLHRNTILSAPMDDVLLAAVAQAGGADIAFSNGWRYGAPVPPGPVTMNDLWNMIPGDPEVSTIDLTGGEIREMMEENLERTFASDPFNQMGGYLKRFRGLTIYGKLENPPGHRIEHIFTRQGALIEGDDYKVAFVTAQGVPKKFGRNRKQLNIHAIDALRRYFKEGQPNRGGFYGRFIPV